MLSTADNATSPAFAAGPGYDLATGLGSPNVYSLVNAPQWSGGGLATNVTLTLSQATIAADQSVTLLATVTDQERLPVLGGTVTFYSGNTVLGVGHQPMLATRDFWPAVDRIDPGRSRELSEYICLVRGRRAELPAKNRHLLRVAVGSSYGRGEPGTARRRPPLLRCAKVPCPPGK